jgi:hypothetical protein
MVFGKKKLLLLCRLSLKFSTGFVLISLVHPSEAGFIGFGCGVLTTIGIGGHMLFSRHMDAGIVHGFFDEG